MAAKNTVNVQKMRSAISELENIHSNMQKHMKSLDETMSSVKKVWKGEAASEYLKQYQKNQKDFQNMAEAKHATYMSLRICRQWMLLLKWAKEAKSGG